VLKDLDSFSIFSLHARGMKVLKRKSAAIPSPRWLAYATAGVATSLAASTSTEAEIHYSGILNFEFSGRSQVESFRLTNNVQLNFSRFTYSAIAGDLVAVNGAARSEEVRKANWRSPYFAEKLSFGQKGSHGQFDAQFHQRAMVSLYGNGQFRRPGEGYVAFRFDDGQGKQYGWARVRMGREPQHKFVLEDYAFADPGEGITAGQTGSTSDDAIPVSGSLGGLALGVVGLLAWRKSRSRTEH